MRSGTEGKTERKRKTWRLNKRALRGCKLAFEESKFDIPTNCELSQYWRRWSELKRDIDAACRRFWQKRKGKRAYTNKRAKFQREKLSCEISVFEVPQNAKLYCA